MFFSPLEQFEILYTIMPKTACLMYNPLINYDSSSFLVNFFNSFISEDIDFDLVGDDLLVLKGYSDDVSVNLSAEDFFVDESVYFFLMDEEILVDIIIDSYFIDEDINNDFEFGDSVFYLFAYAINDLLQQIELLNSTESAEIKDSLIIEPVQPINDVSNNDERDSEAELALEVLEDLESRNYNTLELFYIYNMLDMYCENSEAFEQASNNPNYISDLFFSALYEKSFLVLFPASSSSFSPEELADLFSETEWERDVLPSDIDVNSIKECVDCDNNDGNSPTVCPMPNSPTVCPMPTKTVLSEDISKEEEDFANISFEILNLALDSEELGLLLIENFIINQNFFDYADYVNEVDFDFIADLESIILIVDYNILTLILEDYLNITISGLEYLESSTILDIIFNVYNYAFFSESFNDQLGLYSKFLFTFKYTLIAFAHPLFLVIGFFSSNLFFTLIVLLILIGLMFLFFSLQFFLVPRNFHLFMLYYYSFIKSIIVDLINHPTGKKYYFQLISLLFVILNLLNIYGLIPYTFVLTSQFSFTFFCSFIFFCALNFTGVTVHGLHLFSLFFPSGAPIFISPLLVIIEFISYFARVFSLAIRLFANITAGHILLKILSWFTWSMLDIVFASVVSTLIITVLWVLEFFISVLQAYVFTILVCIYLNDVLNLH